MSVQSTTDSGRPLLGALHWALPRLAGYVLAALGSVLAFTIWAVVYTYVWPSKPVSIEAPAPAISLEAPAPTPFVDPTPSAPAPVGVGPLISYIPSDALPITHLRKLPVYDVSNAKIGRIEDVLVGYDGKVIAYILGVGGGFLGTGEKDIAVPFEAVQFKKKDDSTWFSVLYMTKEAVQKAPKQKFDPAAMMWAPDPAR
jgi:sporulation protein YlmC with PRC-barrel domain